MNLEAVHSNAPANDYECVIGLEVHVQLATGGKLFCPCSYSYGAPPNSQTCPICLGYPGTLPALQTGAVDLALRLCLALEAEIQPRSVFDRKSYFYPDLPKGYQITQQSAPLALGGKLPLIDQDHSIRLLRLHLEEDAGKRVQGLAEPSEPGGRRSAGDTTDGIDFNRAGVALLEIVSAPEIPSPQAARDALRSLRQVLLYTGVSNGNMEQGSLRCDANISLRARGTQALGRRVEIKNLNSTRHVARALQLEFERQRSLLLSGRPVESETRSFDPAENSTQRLRSKEDSRDYRYHAEPDVPALCILPSRLELHRKDVGILPWQWRRRLLKEGRGLDEARDLTRSPRLLDYYQRTLAMRPERGQVISNWIRGELLRELKRRRADDPALILEPDRLVDLIDAVDSGVVSSSGAKRVLQEMWEDPASARDIARRLDLVLDSDHQRLQGWIREVLSSYPQQVDAFRCGKEGLLGFFVGQVMARSGGRAAPQQVAGLLRQHLMDTTDG